MFEYICVTINEIILLFCIFIFNFSRSHTHKALFDCFIELEIDPEAFYMCKNNHKLVLKYNDW